MQWREKIFYRLLIVLLSVIIVHALIFWLSRDVFPAYNYIDIGAPFGWLYGPLFYYLLKTGEEKELYRRDLVHLLPFSLILPVFLLLLMDSSWRNKFMYTYLMVMYIGVGVSWLSYTTWIFAQKNRNKKSKINKILNNLAWGLMFILGIFLLYHIPLLWDDSSKVNSAKGQQHLFILSCMLFFSALSYLYLMRQLTLKPSPRTAEHPSEPADKTPVDVKSAPATTQEKMPQKKYLERINKFISNKEYLDSSMNFEKFAAAVQIPKAHLSLLFQEYYKVTFSFFINQLRIQYACNELERVDFCLSVDELADKCGFRSRASFYRNFNQLMECTPLEYRSRVLKNL